VRDFDSTNGTFVNNAPVKGEVELSDGDQLKIGPLLFKVAIEATAAVNHPTPPPPTKAAAQTGRPAKAATPAPVASKEGASTPLPATSAAATSGKRDDSNPDDDIAAMLLSLHDDGASGITSGTAEVPEGSTVHEMPLPPEVAAQMAQQERDKAPTKPAAPANTSQAAKSILEKYMKRPRGG
jgi:pSer/pThr/pTyr-binding forkhead associated (FHA) protein